MNVTIIGAGVSGLTTAYLLKKQNIRANILEARDRIGGRTKTITISGAKADLGAAWIWPHHRHISALVKELELDTYPQYETGYSLFETPTELNAFEPPASNHSRRLTDGIQSISQALAEQLKGQISLQKRVANLKHFDTHVELTLNTGETIQTDKVIIAMPPRVIAKTLSFSPNLPKDLQIAQEQTHTWMGNSAKAIISFEKPFWREKQLSGSAISYAGPLGELHDNSPKDASIGIIKGFFAGIKAFSGNKAQRQTSVINQLTKLYGPEAKDYLDYQEYAWWQDKLSSAPKDHLPLREHPIYGNQLLTQTYWNKKLYFAGAETATEQGGYLDGAVEAAKRIKQQLLS